MFSSPAGRADVVTTLLAVLELVRQGRIKAQQTELFGEIVLERQQTEMSFPIPDPSPLGAPDAEPR